VVIFGFVKLKWDEKKSMAMQRIKKFEKYKIVNDFDENKYPEYNTGYSGMEEDYKTIQKCFPWSK